MLRGWTTPYRFLSEKRQRELLLEAGVEERVLYRGSEWAEFLRNLRPGDEAVVADLRVFGSRKGLGEASAEVAERGATLVTATGTRIHHPTLEDVQRTESLWAKHRGIGSSKKAKHLNAKAYAAKIAKRDAERMPEVQARMIWLDTGRYPLARDALKAMTGWRNYLMAWREFGPRE
jgi:hypothetical protein